MKNIIKISIKLFLVFNILSFINSFTLSVNNFINAVGLNIIQDNIYKTELIKVVLPFLIIWCINLIVIIILWRKCDTISENIIENSVIDNINITINYENILSVGIIILGLYFIIDSLPKVFSYISNYIVSKSRFVDKNFLKEYTIRQVLEIIGIIMKILFSVMIIKHKDKIIEKMNIKK
jgi:hypothetical protein